MSGYAGYRGYSGYGGYGGPGTTPQAPQLPFVADPALTALQIFDLQRRAQAQNLGAPLRRTPRGGGGLFDIGGYLDKITPDIVGRAARQIGGALIHAPADLFYLAQGLQRDAERGMVGDPSFPNTRRFGGAIAQDIGTRYGPLVRGDFGEFAHQLNENPGYFLMDLGALASAGVGTAARVGRASAAVRGLRGDDGPQLPSPLPPAPIGPSSGGAVAASAQAARVQTARAFDRQAALQVVDATDRNMQQLRMLASSPDPRAHHQLRQLLRRGAVSMEEAERALQQARGGFGAMDAARLRRELGPDLSDVIPEQLSLFRTYPGSHGGDRIADLVQERFSSGGLGAAPDHPAVVQLRQLLQRSATTPERVQAAASRIGPLQAQRLLDDLAAHELTQAQRPLAGPLGPRLAPQPARFGRPRPAGLRPLEIWGPQGREQTGLWRELDEVRRHRNPTVAYESFRGAGQGTRLDEPGQFTPNMLSPEEIDTARAAMFRALGFHADSPGMEKVLAEDPSLGRRIAQGELRGQKLYAHIAGRLGLPRRVVEDNVPAIGEPFQLTPLHTVREQAARRLHLRRRRIGRGGPTNEWLVVDRRRGGPRGHAELGISVRVVNEAAQLQTGALRPVIVQGSAPPERINRHYRILENGIPVGPQLLEPGRARDLAKTYAYERGLGVPYELTELGMGALRSEGVAVRVHGTGELISPLEAVERGRAIHAERQAGRRAGGAQPVPSGDLGISIGASEDASGLGISIGGVADAPEAPSPPRSHPLTRGFATPQHRQQALPQLLDDVARSERGEAPASRPLREMAEAAKAELPDEVKQVVDEVERTLGSRQLRHARQQAQRFQPAGHPLRRRAEEKIIKDTPREQGTSLRDIGLSDRLLTSSGMSAQQAKFVRDQAKTRFEVLAARGQLTPESAAETVRELGLGDELAGRVEDAVRAGQERPRNVRDWQARGSVKQNVERAVERLREAAPQLVAKPEDLRELEVRIRRATQPIFGRAKLSELRAALHKEFGEEVGDILWEASFRARGGSGESAFRVFMKEFLRKPDTKVQTFSFQAPSFLAPTRRRETVFTPQYRRAQDTGRATVSYRRSTRFVDDVEKVTPEAIPLNLSRNPAVAGFQRWYYSWLQEAPEGSRRAPKASAKYAREKDIRQRLERWLAGEELTPRERPPGSIASAGERVGRVADTLNQLQALLLLYTKPGYIPPNLLGQLMFVTIDHHLNPLAMTRTVQLQRSLYAMLKDDPQTLLRMRRVMGEGMYESLLVRERGASRRVQKVADASASTIAKLLDSPWRDNAFINEAWRNGHRTPEAIAELLRAQKGTRLYDDLLATATNANRNIVDYARLGSLEKRVLRRAFLFYPWTKGATYYAGRFLAEHPYQAAALGNLAQVSQGLTEEQTGPLPSFAEGSIVLGSRNVPGLGKVPRLYNPAALGVLGTGGESLQTAFGLLSGEWRASENIANYLNVPLSSFLKAGVGFDPFTGSLTSPEDRGVAPFFSGMLEDLPVTRNVLSEIGPVQRTLGLQPGKASAIESGLLDPAETLYPTSRGEEVGQFLTGIWPRAYNPRVGAERAFAEEQGVRPRIERERFKWTDRLRTATEEARRVGYIPGNGQLPKDLREAVQLKAQRALGYEELAAAIGTRSSDLGARGRLESDLRVLVRLGRMDARTAQQLLSTYIAADETTINTLRGRLDALFGYDTINAHSHAMVQRGADANTVRNLFRLG